MSIGWEEIAYIVKVSKRILEYITLFLSITTLILPWYHVRFQEEKITIYYQFFFTLISSRECARCEEFFHFEFWQFHKTNSNERLIYSISWSLSLMAMVLEVIMVNVPTRSSISTSIAFSSFLLSAFTFFLFRLALPYMVDDVECKGEVTQSRCTEFAGANEMMTWGGSIGWYCVAFVSIFSLFVFFFSFVNSSISCNQKRKQKLIVIDAYSLVPSSSSSSSSHLFANYQSTTSSSSLLATSSSSNLKSNRNFFWGHHS